MQMQTLQIIENYVPTISVKSEQFSVGLKQRFTGSFNLNDWNTPILAYDVKLVIPKFRENCFGD